MVKTPTTKKSAAKKTDHSIAGRRTLSAGRKHMVEIIVGSVEKLAAAGEVIRQTVDAILEISKSQNERLARIMQMHEDTDKQVEHLRAQLLPEGTIVERYTDRIRELEEQLMNAERKHARAMGYIDAMLDDKPAPRVRVPTGEVHAAYGRGGELADDHVGWREVFADLEKERGPKES